MCSQYMMENILGINLFHIHEQKASPIISQKAQQRELFEDFCQNLATELYLAWL